MADFKSYGVRTFTKSDDGTAIINSGNTSITISHSLGLSPVILSVDPLDEYGIGHYITNVTATNFTINIQVPQPSNANFRWGCVV